MFTFSLWEIKKKVFFPDPYRFFIIFIIFVSQCRTVNFRLQFLLAKEDFNKSKKWLIYVIFQSIVALFSVFYQSSSSTIFIIIHN